LAVCTLGSGDGGTVLVQLLPRAQIAAAEQLFSSAATSDKRIEQKVGHSLKEEDRRAVLAQKKLMRDQERLKAVMSRIKATRNQAGPRDLHGPLKLVSAQYSVDLPNGYTRQLNGEYRSEYWTRAYSGSGGFDFAADSGFGLSAVKGGDAIEDVLASKGSARHMNAQERWADRVIRRRDARPLENERT